MALHIITPGRPLLHPLNSLGYDVTKLLMVRIFQHKRVYIHVNRCAYALSPMPHHAGDYTPACTLQGATDNLSTSKPSLSIARHQLVYG